MFSWLKRWFSGRKPARGTRRHLRGSYDAAQVTSENVRHWQWADALSARSANDLATRAILRERSRYEIANNSYAKGLVLTLANNLVGSGPRLQVTLSDQAVNRQIERAWNEWSRAVRLADRLRTLVMAKKSDGEGLALLTTNPFLSTSVKLDVRLFETDQLTTPFLPVQDPLAVDGLRLDEHGNVVEYHVLKYHPGDLWGWSLDYQRVSPRNVIHWYRADRPGQLRGIPELTPSLPLFAQLRRFTLATLTAAETAASFAAMLETDAPPDISPVGPTPFESLEIERGMMTALPSGARLSQLRSEHPAANYEMFVWCILREIARCLHVPLNVVLGDSSKSNFSSARLDHLLYRQAVGVERDDCETEVLEPIFAEWLAEATRLPGLLPPNLPAIAERVPHAWHWPAWEPIDELVEAQAESQRLQAGTDTLARIASEHGQDWREVIRQRAAEAAYRTELHREMGLAVSPDREVAYAT